MKRLVLAAVAIGLVVGAVVLAVNLLRPTPEPPISLARPAAGEVRAAYLPDGTPVWVMGHADGTVDVLSGFDTHVPGNVGKLLWWCPSAMALDNPHHGSKWDEYGVRLGGPAPVGLPSLEVSIRGSRILLGEQRSGPPYGTPWSGPPESDREWCRGPDDDVIVHTFDGWRLWDSPTDALRADPEGWILLEGQLVARPADNRVDLCSPSGCADSVVATGVEVPPPNLGEFGPLVANRFIARVRDGQLVDLTRVVELEPPRR